MLRLNKYPLIGLITLILFACGNRSAQTDLLFQQSSENLAMIISMKKQQLEFVHQRIREMAQFPVNSVKAIPLEQKIKRIVALTEEAHAHISNLRNQLESEQQSGSDNKTVSSAWSQKAGDLYLQTTAFRDSLFNVYHFLSVEFDRSLPLFGIGMDSILQSADDISKLLGSASYPAAMSFLANAEFNIINAGWKCASYCLESIAVHNTCYSGPNLIISQSPQVVLPGASINIGFGIGIYPYGNRYQMAVSTNNRPYEPLQHGIENIQIKAEQTAGHYKVPMKIRYLDQDGVQREMMKTIEYTVVDKSCITEQ